MTKQTMMDFKPVEIIEDDKRFVFDTTITEDKLIKADDPAFYSLIICGFTTHQEAEKHLSRVNEYRRKWLERQHKLIDACIAEGEEE